MDSDYDQGPGNTLRLRPQLLTTAFLRQHNGHRA